MGLWDLPFLDAYIDDNHYAFTRGDNFLVVVTNGLGALQPVLYLSNLKPGVTLCNVLGDRVSQDYQISKASAWQPAHAPFWIQHDIMAGN